MWGRFKFWDPEAYKILGFYLGKDIWLQILYRKMNVSLKQKYKLHMT